MIGSKRFVSYFRRPLFAIFVLSLFWIFYFEGLSAEVLVGQRKRAIIIGATSGMGRQVAKLLATEGGYDVGIVGRRLNLLQSLEKEIMDADAALATDKNIEKVGQAGVVGVKVYIKQIDVAKHEEEKKLLLELIEEMGGLDLMLIAVSAYGDFLGVQGATQLDADLKTIAVDLVGFWVAADIAVEIFKNQKSGHLVGISSISGIRGDANCPVYSGAKAFISKYLEGVRNYMIQKKIPVFVTDIVPGWVDIERIQFSQMPGTYWVTPLNVAAKQIFEAINEKKKIAYISKRQILVKLALEICPDFIFNAIGGF